MTESKLHRELHRLFIPRRAHISPQIKATRVCWYSPNSHPTPHAGWASHLQPHLMQVARHAPKCLMPILHTRQLIPAVPSFESGGSGELFRAMHAKDGGHFDAAAEDLHSRPRSPIFLPPSISSSAVSRPESVDVARCYLLTAALCPRCRIAWRSTTRKRGVLSSVDYRRLPCHRN